MRRLFLTISLTTIALGMLAQNITVMPTDSTVTVPADRTNPEFKGGQKALTIFLTKNLRYPDTAKWTPGTLNGKAVRIKFDLRISFIDPNK